MFFYALPLRSEPRCVFFHIDFMRVIFVPARRVRAKCMFPSLPQKLAAPVVKFNESDYSKSVQICVR